MNGQGNEPVFHQGDLLIATVTLTDPSFQRTAVLLCKHEPENGTYGLVLNRPLRLPTEMKQEYGFVQNHLFAGGPVHQEVMQVIHPYGDTLPGAMQILPGVWFGGDFEQLRSGFTSGIYDAADCRFFLGYAGWDAGQLAMEFALSSWLKVRATQEMVFAISPAELWSRAIREQGKEEPIFSHFPVDPSWN
jgi:putative transcriptional regulator